MAFLNPEQQDLARDISDILLERGQTIAVAESTAGGLISAALLWVAGASRYYLGGGVLYTRNSRIELGGMTAEQFAGYRGSTPEIVLAMAEAMRTRLGATWCVAESGTAGPTGNQPGRTTVAVAGPTERAEVFETGGVDREANMVEFATRALTLLRDVLRGSAGA